MKCNTCNDEIVFAFNYITEYITESLPDGVLCDDCYKENNMSNELLNKKHLKEFSLEELEATECVYCANNMAEYACPNCIKDNDPVCTECCGCCDEDYNDYPESLSELAIEQWRAGE